MKTFFIVMALLFSFALANAEEAHEDHEHAHEAEESSHHQDEEAHKPHNKDDHDDHDEHKEEEETHEHDEDSHKEEASEESHDHSAEGEKHDDHEEENDAIGPTKGILAKSENGFRLTDVAIKNFGIKYHKIDSASFNVSESAIVKVLADKYLFRERDGWFKKIPFKTESKTGDRYLVSISDMKPKDRIVIDGIGFLRTAELVVEEGVAHGHSH